MALLEASESFFSMPSRASNHFRGGGCSHSSCRGCEDPAGCRPSAQSKHKTVPRSPDNTSACPECSRTVPTRCDRNSMRQLRHKCEQLIDVCVNHLSLQLGDMEFAELRERLSSRVCWYLTCERYWDNQQKQRQAQPGGLLVVLILAAIIYFTFSYYMVWVFF